MRAVQIDQHGSIEELQLRDVPQPRPAAGEVLIRTVSSGLNPVDWKTRAWDRGPGMPMTLGWDLAGIVVASESPRFSSGDPVIAMSAQLGTGVGTWAEFVCLPADIVVPAPRGVSLAAAGTLPLTGMTALIAWGQMAPTATDRVLVIGAIGGVGSIMVTLCVDAGIAVDGIVSRDAHVGQALSLGVQKCFTTSADLNSGSYDIILDTAGIAPISALTDGGRYFSITDEPLPDYPGATKPEVYEDGSLLQKVVDLTERGLIVPKIAQAFVVDEVRKAHEVFESGGSVGRIALLF